MTESTQTAAQVALVTGASRGIGADHCPGIGGARLPGMVEFLAHHGRRALRASARRCRPGCRGANLNVNDVAAVEAPKARWTASSSNRVVCTCW